MTEELFLEQIRQGALQTFETYNILPSITAAQSILESNWGKSKLARECLNLFGIKADQSWQGDKKAYSTKEYDKNNKLIVVTAYFRKYQSYKDSLKDHGKFFHENPRYVNVLKAKDYREQARAIQTAGYATDPQYADKLIRLIEQNGLQKWDADVLGKRSTAQVDKSHIHKVRKGETLSEIAKKYNVTVSSIVQVNQIVDKNLIYPDQKLIVPISENKKEGKYYVVKKGDTLSEIAKKFNKTVDKLAMDNHISDIDQIKIGQKLFIED